ncbi:MAG: serine/threonine-protein phosphatase [Polyangiaceae bacterium]|nr:serine/threonine-protein phosphatase [Polyangiaceae bacterium]
MFNPVHTHSAHPGSGPPAHEEAIPSDVKSAPALVMNAYGMSDTGLVRARNEDQFVIATLTGTLWVHQSTIPQARVQCGQTVGHLLIVADGMGGHAGGEQASALAVGAVEEFALSALGWLFRLPEAPNTVSEDSGAYALPSDDGGLLEELKNALRRADATVTAQAAANPEVHGMGTTLTLAYSVGTQLYVAHAGDTRCYLFRDETLHQLTRDHTLVRELVDAGVIQPEEMGRNQYRHVVTNVVGGGKEGLQAEVHRLDLAPGDVLVLTSDGLHDMIEDAEISRILAHEPHPKLACETLIRAALDAGGRDNVTAVVARYDPPGPRPA